MTARPRRRWSPTLAAVGLAAALAACTAEEPAGRAAGSTAAPTAPTTVASTRPPSSPAGVGPLAFVALRYAATQPAADFRRRGGSYQGLKVLAVVEAGATVTLTVPARERRHLSLLYNPAAWKENNRYRSPMATRR